MMTKNYQPKESNNSGTKAKVLLFSVFHFDNPKNDLIETNIHDVSQKVSQQYLQELAQRLSEYHPTNILLEYDGSMDERINEAYTLYRANKHTLNRNEIEQLGFIIAKISKLTRLEGFDDRLIPWKAKALFKQLKKEPHIETRFRKVLAQVTEHNHVNLTTLSLQDILKYYNDPKTHHLNKSLYILTNAAGVDKNFEGAQASASWWHRNFRMLARIQKFAQNGERVLVIGGQGHIAVIRDLIELDPNIISEDIRDYL